MTHYCAPVFMLLAGTGAYLQRLRGKPAGELARFLATRGLWLALVELVVVRFVGFAGLGVEAPFQLGVLWALGLSMVVLAALVWLPTWVAGTFGAATIAAHNLLDGRLATAVWQGPGAPVPGAAERIASVLHAPGFFPVAGWPSPVVVVLYPLVPWVGVMAAGYALGAAYRLDPGRRRRVLVGLGLALTAAFVALRAANGYGDPRPWEPAHPRGALFTALSFLNPQKYPPSLLYLLMTLGPATLLLGALAGQSVAHLFRHMGALAADPPRGVGFGLPAVYAAWVAGVLLCYPLCRWFAGVKARRRDLAWLSYL